MQWIVIVVVSLVLIAVLTCAILFIVARTKPVLGRKERENVPGDFATLSRGVVHYFDDGPRSGETVLLIHGSTVPAVVWDKTVGSLNAAGYRTIRADLYGRGYSDRPRIKYGYDVFVEQNLELLDSLDIIEPVHVMGISLGAAIAVVLADVAPARVASLTLMDPAGPFLDNAPVQERWMRLGKGIKALMEGDSEAAGERRRKLAPLMEQVHAEMKFRGTEYVSVSFMKHRDQGTLSRAFSTVGASGVPSLLIWGEEDPVIPVRYVENVKRDFAGIEVHTVPGGGHAPHYEQPEIVNPVLVDFLLRISVEVDSPAKEIQ